MVSDDNVRVQGSMIYAYNVGATCAQTAVISAWYFVLNDTRYKAVWVTNVDLLVFQ